MALFAVPAAIALALVCVPLLVKLLDRNAGWPLSILFLAVAGYVAAHAGPVLHGEVITASRPWVVDLLPGVPSAAGSADVRFALRLDALSFFFTELALLIGAVVFIYSTRYLHRGKRIFSFYTMMTAFMLSVLLLFLSDDVALLFIGWELVSLASFLLIARAGSSGEAGASRTLLLTFAGGLLLLAAIGVMVAVTGTTQLSLILTSPIWEDNRTLLGVVALLVALAGFSKAAQLPFHFWLPEAMAADTPISAFLHAAAVVKAGIYLLLRFSGIFNGVPAWHLVLITTGMTTAIMGAGYAMQKTDLKKLTAYSTVSQLGWIVATIGVGTPFAIVAAVVHTAAHALFKSSLFMLVGVVDHQAGSRDMRRLGPLWNRMPFTFGSAVIAAASMAAIPPTFGFVSKEGMLEAFLEAPLPSAGVILLLIAAAFGAFLTFMYSVRYVFGAFVDGPKDESATVEASPSLWIPAALPGVLSLPIVAVMHHADYPLDAMAAATGVGSAKTHLALWHGINVPLGISAAVLLTGALGIAYRKRLFAWISPLRLGVSTGVDLLNSALRASSRWSHYVSKPAESLSPNRHVTWIFLMLITLGMFAVLGPGRLAGLSTLEPRQPGIDRIGDLVGLVIVAGAVVGIVSTRSRMASIVLVGVAGAGTTWMMLTLGAPDVAQTQILVEFAIVAFMMLVARHQPRLYLREGQNRAKFASAISVLVGLVTFFGVWLLIGRHPRPDIALWYLENTQEISGGNNIVAIILVEFRAFDTLGELGVLGMAGVVIAAIIRSIPKSPVPGYGPGSTSELFRPKGATRFPDVHKIPELAPFYSKYLRSTHLNSIPTRLTLSALLPVLAVFSAVTVWRGHQEPGGGFLGALIAATALLVWYMGQSTSRTIGGPDLGYRLIGGGILLSLGVGLMGYAKGSFLAPIHGYVAGVHLSTSLLFDMGVFAAVLGLVIVSVNFMGARERPGAEVPERYGREDRDAVPATPGTSSAPGTRRVDSPGSSRGSSQGSALSASTGVTSRSSSDADQGASPQVRLHRPRFLGRYRPSVPDPGRGTRTSGGRSSSGVLLGTSSQPRELATAGVGAASASRGSSDSAAHQRELASTPATSAARRTATRDSAELSDQERLHREEREAAKRPPAHTSESKDSSQGTNARVINGKGTNTEGADPQSGPRPVVPPTARTETPTNRLKPGGSPA